MAEHQHTISSLGCLSLPRRHATATACLATATLLCLFTAFLGPGMIQRFMDQGILHTIIWRSDSPPDTDMRYRGICDPRNPDAIYWHSAVYLYNITNLDQIRQGSKPEVALVGPFRFIKVQCKLDVWWDAHGHVSAKDYTRYLADPAGPQRGDADLDAPITTLNLALGSVIEAVHGSVSPSTARLLDLVVSVLAGWRDKHVSGMFIHRTARELLYGYQDPLLVRLAHLLPKGTVPRTQVQLLQNVTSREEAANQPPSVYDTGRDDVQRIWTMLEDKGSSEVTGWPGGDACVEQVRGTDGMQFRPGLHCKRDVLQMWVGPLFRSTHLVCTGVQRFFGVKVLRYWPEPTWSAPDPCKQQYISGLLNITAPSAVGPNGNGSQALGMPLFISRPHFCGADASLRAGVVGLPPCVNVDEDLSIWMDVEPITGITMRASSNIMLSSQVSAAARMHLEPKLNASPIVPVFWQHETIQGKEEQAQMFVSLVYRVRRIKAQLRVWPLLLALVCAAVCACVLVHASIQHTSAVCVAWQQEQEQQRSERSARIQRAIMATQQSGSLYGAGPGLGGGAGGDEEMGGRAGVQGGSGAASGEIVGASEETGLRQPLLAPNAGGSGA